MCGIAGAAARGAGRLAAPPPGPLLAHRGPDGHAEARWTGSTAQGWLRHTRLAIVDRGPAGDQPVYDSAGRYAVAFNGEIYNHVELRQLCEARGHRLRTQMDGEVLPHLWADEGPACLTRLNGIFALTVVDTWTGQLWLTRDPLGVKPLFHASDADACAFASEPAAVAAVTGEHRELDLVALAQFLTFLWVPAPRSPYRGVSHVRPGHVLHWVPGRGAVERPYARLVPSAEPAPRTLTGATAELRELLLAAAEQQLLGDVPVALMASGGLDSSLLWWAAQGRLERAYAVDWAEGPDDAGERLHEDAAAVREVSRHLGGPVTFISGDELPPLRPGPSGDLIADPAYALTRGVAARSSSEGRPVLWSGQGADELLGGYRRHRVARLLGTPGVDLLRLGSRLPAPPFLRGDRREYLARLTTAAGAPDFFARYMHLCTYSTAEDRARALGCTSAEVADEVVWAEHREAYDSLPGGLSTLRRAMAVDLQVYLPGLGLAYSDRAAMEVGVEVRVPWLDHQLVRWSLDLPDAVLLALKGKGPARALAREVLPALVAGRPKRGFASPVARVQPDRSRHGSRGHRQGAYFAQAAALVEQVAGSAPAADRTPAAWRSGRAAA